MNNSIEKGNSDGLIDFRAIKGRNKLKQFLRIHFFINPIVHLFRGYVLDIGCGNGEYLEQYTGPHLGIDALESNIKICNSKGIEAIKSDANLFIMEETFDTVLMSHVLEHLEKPEIVISNACHSVKKGGHLIIILPCFEGFVSGLNEQVGHKQFVTEEYVEPLLKEFNFRKVKSYKFPPFFGGKYKEVRLIFEKK